MLVGRGGVEPPTFHFSGGRSYQLSYLPERRKLYNRTTGNTESDRGARNAPDDRSGAFVVSSVLATPTGLEPAASAVTGRRANQLRYGALCVA